MANLKPANILLVEDNLDDIRILRRALNGREMLKISHIARDGQEAVDFLLGKDEGTAKGSRTLPDLILLDLNLPRLNGIEVLKTIRANASLSLVPVIMLTSSSRDEDVARSYEAGSNTYVQKPVEFDHFVRALEVIEDYWARLARLPSAVVPAERSGPLNA